MIEELCRKYEIENYSINPDGSIDVDGDVNLYGSRLTELPLKFNKVTRDFECSNNGLTSLVGCPKYVGGDFSCSGNDLTSLVGCPIKVGGDFSCSKNYLTSLVGCPIKVGGDFSCSKNYLTSLVGGPKEVGEGFGCSDNKLTNLEGIPDIIGNDIYCRDNDITDLTGLNKFGGRFYCTDNPIGSIFNDVESDFTYAFQVYQVINGNEINLKRLKYVMSTWNLPIDLKEIEKHYKLV